VQKNLFPGSVIDFAVAGRQRGSNISSSPGPTLMEIQLLALLCSDDPRTVKVLQLLLGEMAIAVEVCASRAEAGRHLVSRHFDGVFVDGDLAGAAQLLRDVHNLPSGRRAVSFAIVFGSTSVKEACAFGASFILYKPLSIEKTKTSLRAAHGLMMRERRRHFRHGLEGVHAALSFAGVPETQAEILDLSQGGMSLRLMEYLERRGELRIRFTLPGLAEAIAVEGEVTWADRYGRVGVRFSVMRPGSRELLDEWLGDRSRSIARDTAAAVKPRRSRTGAVVARGAAAAPAPAKPAASSADEARPRQTIRAGLEIGLSVMVIRSGEPRLMQAVCDDLTPEGAGIKVNGELCPGEPVLVHLSLPSLETMSVHADVRHRRGSRIGLEFVGLTREQRDQLVDICQLLPIGQ
jgi:hypothetical protein